MYVGYNYKVIYIFKILQLQHIPPLVRKYLLPLILYVRDICIYFALLSPHKKRNISCLGLAAAGYRGEMIQLVSSRQLVQRLSCWLGGNQSSHHSGASAATGSQYCWWWLDSRDNNAVLIARNILPA